MKAWRDSWTSTLKQCFCCQRIQNLCLENLLCPSSCPPLDLETFKCYLAEKEFSVENLDFYVWFASYRRIFDSLPEDQKAASPELNTILKVRARGVGGFPLEQPLPLADPLVPNLCSSSTSLCSNAQLRNSTCSFDGLSVPDKAFFMKPMGRLKRYSGTKVSPYGSVSLAEGSFLSARTRNGIGEDPTELSTDIEISCGQHENRSDENDEKIATCTSLPTIYPGSSLPPSSAQFLSQVNKTRPLKEDVDFAIGNYFTVGSHTELNLDQTVRERVVEHSKLTTHPSIFMEVHQKVELHLKTVSLPNFVESSQLHKQLQKRYRLFQCSLISSVIGIIIFITTRLRNFHRYWSLLSIPFVFLGQWGLFFSMSGFWTVMFRKFHGKYEYWSMGTENSPHVVVIPVHDSAADDFPLDDDDGPWNALDRWASIRKPPRKKTLQQKIETHCFIFTITDTTIMILLILFA